MSAVRQPAVSLDAPLSLLGSFDEHYAALLRFLSRRAGHREDVHELAHETWLRVAQAQAQRPSADTADPLPASTAIDHPRAYLFAVAANLMLDRQRRDQRARQVVVAAHAGDDDERSPPAPQPQTPDVAEVHAHRQALRAIDAALQQLPVRVRACFLAHRLDGVGQDELAQRHGVSVKTVERDVKRARDHVHAAMARWDGHPALPVDGPARRRRRTLLSAVLGIAGVGSAGLLGWQAWQAATLGDRRLLATAVGQRLAQRLADGSRVTLDADSRAEAAYDASQRGLRLLRGSAFFEVAHEDGPQARAFVVEAGGAVITALGTRFGVELDDGATLRVAVEAGRVSVRSATGRRRVIGAGEQAQLGPGTGTDIDVRALRDPTDAAAWRHGWLDFEMRPLREVVARLARYSRQPLRVAADAAGLSVLARVRIASTAEWLALLPRQLPVRLEPQPDGALLIRRR